MLAYQAVYHGIPTPIDPTIFKAKKGTDPDEHGLIEALSSYYSEQCTKSMTEEITNIVKQRTCDVIHKSEVPEGYKIIPGNWDSMCKRFPDGSLRKFKARFCVGGYIHKRISDVHMHTYAPVVRWYMMRLMLVLTCTMGLRTQSTDFSRAFYQAKIKQPVYLQPPAK